MIILWFVWLWRCCWKLKGIRLLVILIMVWMLLVLGGSWSWIWLFLILVFLGWMVLRLLVVWWCWCCFWRFLFWLVRVFCFLFCVVCRWVLLGLFVSRVDWLNWWWWWMWLFWDIVIFLVWLCVLCNRVFILMMWNCLDVCLIVKYWYCNILVRVIWISRYLSRCLLVIRLLVFIRCVCCWSWMLVCWWILLSLLNVICLFKGWNWMKF